MNPISLRLSQSSWFNQSWTSPNLDSSETIKIKKEQGIDSQKAALFLPKPASIQSPLSKIDLFWTAVLSYILYIAALLANAFI
jgi:hypothetical protein